MKFNEKDYTKLENALIKAYQEKEKPRADEQWEMNVMQRIRALGPLSFKASFFDLFDQCAWRFAPAFCVVIVLLTFWMAKLDFVPEEEMARLSIEQPVEADYVEMNGF